MKLSVVFALVACAAVAHAANLTVRVENLDPKGGTLHVALYDQSLWSNDDADPIAGAIVPATLPVTTVTLRNVKPGVYGVKVYQDANNNDTFDKNFVGYPLERFGFSRDARPHLSEPGFDRVQFSIHPGDNAIEIHLQ